MVEAVASLLVSNVFPRKNRNRAVSKSVPLLDGINLSPPSFRLGVFLDPGVPNLPGDLFGVLALESFGVLQGVFLRDSFNLLPAPLFVSDKFAVRRIPPPETLTLLALPEIEAITKCIL